MINSKMADGRWQMAEKPDAHFVLLSETSTGMILAVRRST